MTTIPDDVRVWRVELHAGGETVSVGGSELVEPPRFSMQAGSDWRAGLRVHAGGACEVRLVAERLRTVRAWLDAGAAVVLRLWLTREAGDVPILAGRVVEWTRDGRHLVLRAVRDLPWDGEQTVCRDLAALPEGVAWGIRPGAWLPQVFGEATDVAGVALFAHEAVRAVAAIAASDRTIALARAVDWPSRGRVQVGDEVLEYRALSSSPPRLEELVRPAARSHAGRPMVHRIGATAPAWVVADHAAEVLEVRGGSPEGEPVAAVLIEPRTLAGRTTTTVAMARLPLDVRHDLLPARVRTDVRADHWTVVGATTCLRPLDAFTSDPTIKGAYFFPTRNVLIADWRHDLARDDLRHARLLRLWLAFEVDTNAFWRKQTRLHVTITRGERSVHFTVTDLHEWAGLGYFERSIGLGAALAMPAAMAQSASRWVVEFDAVSAASRADWTEAGAALEGSFESWAWRAETEKAGRERALQARLLRERLPRGRRLARVGLFARVRSSVEAARVRLRLHLPGGVLDERTWFVGTAWQTLGGLVNAKGMAAETLLRADARFELVAERGQTLDVAGMWLEAEADALATSSAKGLSEPSVVVSGAVAQALASRPFAVDVAGLFEDGPSWEVLAAGGETLRLQMVLLDGHEQVSVSVRGICWEAEVLRARSVEPTARVFAQVRGRATQADGACDPAAVVETLLTDEDFAGGAIEPPSLEDLSERSAHFGRRYRRVVADGTLLDAACRSALAESGSVLAPRGMEWAVARDEALDSMVAAHALGVGDMLEWPGAIEARPGALAARALQMHGPDGARVAGGDGDRVAAMRLEWLVAGAGSLCRHLTERFARPERAMTLAVPMAWLEIGPHTLVRVLDPWERDLELRGVVREQRHAAGRLEWSVEVRARGRACWESGDAVVWRDMEPARVLVWLGGHAVAAWTATGLLLRGVVREGQTAGSPGTGLFVDGAGLTIGCGAGSTGKALVLTRAGDLLLPVGLATGEELAHAAPAEAIRTTNDEIVIGTPEAGTLGALERADGRLRLVATLIERALA
ncbi:MAG: hypothetical protein KF858_13225 [Candidatus Sumerlaeia bacterium]|nr:hypothetical protein [Candidatus Sumerlaeia bacterium]